MEKATLSIRLTGELHKWLKEEAEKRGMSINALISYVLSEYREDKEF
jgi:predicted HicB family RNase H-like nuclease